jgi:pyruvate formate lyase activating enzyme
LREWRASTWVEVSTVILPGLNDTADSLNRLIDSMLEAAGPETPWHLMRFFPSFQMARAAPGAVAELRVLRTQALARGLNYVYLSNVPGLAEVHTNCPRCDESLIHRGAGRSVDNRMVDGRCPACGWAVAGRGMNCPERSPGQTIGGI